MHVNIRSLNKTLMNFMIIYNPYLSFIHSAICLSESRIKNQRQVNFELAGYNFININPESNVRGVAMYIHNRIKYTLDKRFSLQGCECLWLLISIAH